MITSAKPWTRAYLEFLGVAPADPTADYLSRLTERQLARVPFENVTTLLRYRDHWGEPLPSPDPERLLDRWIRGAGGGLCYEVSSTFGLLLGQLGFEVTPILGTITWPDSHQALLVQCEGKRFLVDAGNGAPFFHPFDVSQTHIVAHAGLKYRFRPGSTPKSYLQERWIQNQWQGFCTLSLTPPTPEAVYYAFSRHHLPDEGKFMGELTLVRCTPDSLHQLHNREYTLFTAEGKTRRPVQTLDDYRQLAQDAFLLPELDIAGALAVLDELGVIL